MIANRSVLTFGVLMLALFSSSCARCVSDLLLLPEKRAFNALKNRTALPSPADFDPRASLAAMLEPGDDRSRWQQTRAGVIGGFVVRIHDAGPESANCFSATRLDTHIEIAERPDDPPNRRVIVEITPPMRDRAGQRGIDWSTPTLQREFTGKWVRVEGWFLFDDEHDEESENTRPGYRDNWRATAWELHPVTAIQLTAYSLQLTAHSLQLTAHGSRLMAHGLRLTAHSSRLTAHGLRLTAYGSWLTAHSLQLTAHSSQLTAHGWRPTA
jgi:hypothetical protein